MKKTNIYAGRFREYLVLKSQVFDVGKDIYRYYDINESPKITTYFLKLNIPRVSTPDEIVNFSNNFKLKEHLHKPFVYEVYRHEA